MKIYFKNGTSIEIIEEIGEVLRNLINAKPLIPGCSNLQTFSDENGKLLLIVNIDEVVCIQ
jgi:hypothetical protein